MCPCPVNMVPPDGGNEGEKQFLEGNGQLQNLKAGGGRGGLSAG